MRHILLQFSLLNTSKYYFKLFYHRLLDIRKEILHIFFLYSHIIKIMFKWYYQIRSFFIRWLKWFPPLLMNVFSRNVSNFQTFLTNKPEQGVKYTQFICPFALNFCVPYSIRGVSFSIGRICWTAGFNVSPISKHPNRIYTWKGCNCLWIFQSKLFFLERSLNFTRN